MENQGALVGYSDGDVDTNHTNNPTLQELVDRRYSRRKTLLGGLSASAMASARGRWRSGAK
jgi:secreted PhoX family phosphatase